MKKTSGYLVLCGPWLTLSQGLDEHTSIIPLPLTLLKHNVSEALLTFYDLTATEMQNM